MKNARLDTVLIALSFLCAACPGAGAGEGEGEGEGEGAWTGGPRGTLYVAQAPTGTTVPLYVIDTETGSITRELALPSSVSSLVADATGAYFNHEDGVYRFTADMDEPEQIASDEGNWFGIGAGYLLGLNNGNLIRLELATVAFSESEPFGGVCERAVVDGDRVHVVCHQLVGTRGTGVRTADIATGVFEPFQLVAETENIASVDSILNVTPSGLVLAFFDGDIEGPRSMIHVPDGAPLELEGTSVNIDSTALIGDVIYVGMDISGFAVPYNTATRTAGTPIDIDRTRSILSGGEFIFAVGGGGIQRITPATGEVAELALPRAIESSIDYVSFVAD